MRRQLDVVASLEGRATNNVLLLVFQCISPSKPKLRLTTSARWTPSIRWGNVPTPARIGPKKVDLGSRGAKDTSGHGECGGRLDREIYEQGRFTRQVGGPRGQSPALLVYSNSCGWRDGGFASLATTGTAADGETHRFALMFRPLKFGRVTGVRINLVARVTTDHDVVTAGSFGVSRCEPHARADNHSRRQQTTPSAARVLPWEIHTQNPRLPETTRNITSLDPRYLSFIVRKLQEKSPSNLQNQERN
jgi:hypothetical protein